MTAHCSCANLFKIIFYLILILIFVIPDSYDRSDVITEVKLTKYCMLNAIIDEPSNPLKVGDSMTMTIKIEVYTSTCGKCKKLEQIVHEAVNELKLDAEIVKLQDGIEVRNRGVTRVPAFFVNGKLVLEGRVPLIREAMDLIEDAISDISYA